MMFLALTSVLLAIASAPGEQQGGLEFQMKGAILVNQGATVEFIDWQRVPQASDFPDINRNALVYEATVTASCQATSDGRLEDCEIAEMLPSRPELRPIFRKALDLLVMQPSSVQQAKGAPFILVSVMMSNPGGTDANKSYCGGFFCTVVPPPPPPSPERS